MFVKSLKFLAIIIIIVSNSTAKDISIVVTPEKPKHSPKTGTLKAIKWYNNDQ